MKTHIPNTYDLIIESQSEDKSRNLMEALIYTIFILSAVVSIFSAAAQTTVVPKPVASQSVCTEGQPC